MLLVLINDALENKTYSEKSLLTQKYKVLQETYMNGEARRVSSLLGTEESEKEALEKQQNTLEALQTDLKDKANKLNEFLKSKEFKDFLSSDEKNKDRRAFLQKNEISDDDKQALFEYAKFLYECGQYDDALKILTDYPQVSKPSHIHAVIWGLLNSQILLGESQSKSLEGTFEYLKALIFQSKTKKQDSEKMYQKNMLLNTALFVFPYTKDPSAFLYDLYSSNESIISSISPHLNRYYATAAMLQGKTVSILQRDSYQEMFLVALLEEFDFDQSFRMIGDVVKACKSDYFLKSISDKVEESCQRLIIHTYSKAHDSINISRFATNLGKNEQDSIKFIQSVLDDNKIENKLSDDKSEIVIIN